ncbi:cdc42 homolog isoform X2 [Varroa jacobsoni]|uniref:Uncharacterized protein n=1 Tax=Varroa destructor TaxID=109461 RepID=A0A7M7JCH9_VARDE|nr:cdc42 homolog isoform X2 [Varroa destructor]XP_022695867.1 cdc42 homolog isoform X2 [Varroa jacobsoni]
MMLRRRNDESAPDIKVVLLGDSNVGKTAMIYSYTLNIFHKKISSTCMDSYEVTVNVKQKETILGICDTAGNEEFDTLRQLAYPGSDAFIICFSLVDRSSFEHVCSWVNELRIWELHSPVILVATKKDLRDAQNSSSSGCINPSFISFSEGQRLAHQIQAIRYIETSAYTQEGIKDAFDTAIMIKLNGVLNVEKRKKKCTLL